MKRWGTHAHCARVNAAVHSLPDACSSALHAAAPRVDVWGCIAPRRHQAELRREAEQRRKAESAQEELRVQSAQATERLEVGRDKAGFALLLFAFVHVRRNCGQRRPDGDHGTGKR